MTYFSSVNIVNNLLFDFINFTNNVQNRLHQISHVINVVSETAIHISPIISSAVLKINNILITPDGYRNYENNNIYSDINKFVDNNCNVIS
jgi:hypothetical protein